MCFPAPSTVPCTRQVFRRYRKSWLFWCEGSQTRPVVHLGFLAIPSPVTECWSRLQCLAHQPSRANPNNSSSGKALRAPLYPRTIALSFICCTLGATLDLCPRLDSNEMSHDWSWVPKETNKLLSTYLWTAASQGCTYHVAMWASRAQHLPRQCENHKPCFPFVF